MRTMVSMALRPRSRTRVRPPVLRSRWKRSDKQMHVLEGEHRQPPHRVHRHLGENAVAPLRQHAPSGCACRHRRASSPPAPPAPRRANCWRPIGAVPWPASASVAHLKVNGTAMVASLAAKISTVANTHASLQVAAVGRPDVGPQMEQRREQRRAVGRTLRGRGCGGSLNVAALPSRDLDGPVPAAFGRHIEAFAALLHPRRGPSCRPFAAGFSSAPSICSLRRARIDATSIPS